MLIYGKDDVLLPWAAEVIGIEGYHPHGMPDDDLISLGMLRSNCRFIPREFRQ